MPCAWSYPEAQANHEPRLSATRHRRASTPALIHFELDLDEKLRPHDHPANASYPTSVASSTLIHKPPHRPLLKLAKWAQSAITFGDMMRHSDTNQGAATPTPNVSTATSTVRCYKRKHVLCTHFRLSSFLASPGSFPKFGSGVS